MFWNHKRIILLESAGKQHGVSNTQHKTIKWGN